MSRKSKLVLKMISTTGNFEIVKSVNTLEFGVPGDALTRKNVDLILKDSTRKIQRGDLVVEFLKGSA